MVFGNQQILTLLVLVPVAGLLLLLALRRRRRLLRAFGEWSQVERLLGGAWLGVHALRAVLWTGAFALLLLVLARPQFGNVEETIIARGVDVIIAVDTSTSMLATDIKPTRLDRAKEQLADLITRLRGHRIGLISFAGAAMLQCPLTLDQTILHQTLGVMDTQAVGVPGTAIAEAVRLAVRSFDQSSPRHRVLVLLTDGEDHEGDIDKAAREAAEAQVTIYAVAIGTSGGAPVPAFDAWGRSVGFKQNPDGSTVVSRMATLPLLTLATATHGRAFETSNLGQVEINSIARAIDAMPQRDLEEEHVRHRAEQFQAFLLPAILLLLLEPLLLTRRWRRRRAAARALRPATAALLLLVAVLPARAEDAARVNNEGVSLHREGKLDEALERYHQADVAAPNTPQVAINIGNVRYDQGHYGEAADQFSRATEAPDSTLRAAAQYDLGTAQLNVAQESARQSDLDQALRQIDESIGTLRQSLIAAPEDREAKFNLELAMRLRDEWRRQQQQQQQQQQNQQSQNQQNQNQQNQSQQNQQQQNQQQQNQDQQDQQNQQSQQDQQSQRDQQNQQDQRNQQSQNQQDQQSQQDQQQQQQQQNQQNQNQQNQNQQNQQQQNQQGQEQQSQSSQSNQPPPSQPPDPNAARALSQRGEEQQQPMTPQQIQQQGERERAEAYLDALPFQEYPQGMRNLLGVQGAPPRGGPDW
jgi:Ca-activated chloride channel family protein